MNFLNPFYKPPALALAKTELDDARRHLLAAQSGLEYASSLVKYNEDRIKRLEIFVAGQS